MGEIQFISLFDYLGKAAGSELGKKVYLEALVKNIPHTTKKIHNKTYSGKIMVYPKSFLDKFFKVEQVNDLLSNGVGEDNLNIHKYIEMETKIKNPRYAVISLSGGMDSSTLLLRLLAEGYHCTALSFDYGQKHKVELERATELVEYINNRSGQIVGDEAQMIYPPVTHQIIKIDGLGQLLNSTLVEGGKEVPEGHYAEENQRATVVPNRNKIFSSIIQSVALSIADSKNTECVIAMGIHAGDFSVYPDCRQEFRDIDYEAFVAGNWGAEKVTYYTPYINVMKLDILKDGEKCCEQLGLNFDEVYKRTNTSYKPIQHTVYWKDENGETVASTEWFSDYKSASSVERILAFSELGRKDPASYADEFGPVTWDIALNDVLEVDRIFKQNSSSL
jgi:7-cyano-7-deazaguanine synthase